MLLLYRGLIGSVLEYGSVCYAGMLLLEHVQYRALRISMGLMGSTPNNSLGDLSGIPQLRHRLFYLSFRYLVNTFQKNEHPLRDRLEKLYDLSPQKCLISFHEVGYTRHELGAILSTPKVNRHMEVALSGVHIDMYPIVAPLKLRMGIALFSPSNLFYTDGWIGWFCRPSFHRLQYRILDERASECFHGGACGDPHGYGPYRN
jgi:hypothetical protein